MAIISHYFWTARNSRYKRKYVTNHAYNSEWSIGIKLLNILFRLINVPRVTLATALSHVNFYINLSHFRYGL